MYLQHFGLSRYPFDAELHIDELYPSRAVGELDGRVRHLVELRGIGLVTGEAGSGKTTACRRAADALHPAQHKVCYASLTTGTVLDTLNVIAAAMALPPQRQRGPAWQAIRDETVRLGEEKKLLPVLIIDEAHHLRNDTLEDLRLLTNFNFESERRLCLMLVGLTQLRNRLSMSMHESLSQRLVMQHHFGAMDLIETQAYLKHRLTIAGGADLHHLSQAAVENIFQAAHGIPRQINRIAHYTLLAAAKERTKQAGAEHVEIACTEMRL